MKNIIKEWENCNRIRVFEFEVFNRVTREKEWVMFDIELDAETGQFKASHEALNQAEKDSEYIAYVVTDIDPDFSLDENLQELYDACTDAIERSEFFKLWDISDQFDVYTLPAFFASALINSDTSGLTDCETWLLAGFCADKGACMGCSDDQFFTQHHEFKIIGACDCKEFYFGRKTNDE